MAYKSKYGDIKNSLPTNVGDEKSFSMTSDAAQKLRNALYVHVGRSDMKGQFKIFMSQIENGMQTVTVRRVGFGPIGGQNGQEPEYIGL